MTTPTRCFKSSAQLRLRYHRALARKLDYRQSSIVNRQWLRPRYQRPIDRRVIPLFNHLPFLIRVRLPPPLLSCLSVPSPLFLSIRTLDIFTPYDSILIEALVVQ